MRLFRSLASILAALLLLTPSARAQDSNPDPASLVDDATIGAMGFRLDQADPNALATWLGAIIEKTDPALLAPDTRTGISAAILLSLATAKADLDQLASAGARELWFYATFRGFPNDASFAAVWTNPDPDVPAIARWMKQHSPGLGETVTRLPGLVLIGAAPLVAPPPVTDPARAKSVRELLAAGANSKPFIRGFLIPSESTRKAFEELAEGATLPNLNIPILPLVRNLQVASLSITFPPNLTLAIDIRSPDAPGAAALAATLNQIIDKTLSIEEFRASVPDAPRILELLRPRTTEVRSLIALDPPAAAALVEGLLPSVLNARRQAQQVVQATNVRGVVQGLVIYESNSNAWPADLQVLVKETMITQDMTVDRDGKPLVYLKPAKDAMQHDPQNVVVVHEPCDPWPAQGIWVGFLDAHVARVATKAEFDALLAPKK